MIRYKTSNGGKFEYPNSLMDITLRQYIEYLDFVEPTKPEELKKIEQLNIAIQECEKEKEIEKLKEDLDHAIEAITSKVMYKKVYPFYARVVSHFSKGMTEAEILGGKKQGDGMNIGHLTLLYNNIVDLLNNPDEPEYSPVIMVDKELWYLPRRYMEKSKLIEYAEASQFEENLEKVSFGQWKAIPKIMCVLVRKENELYTDKLLEREEMFLDWSLENCMKVAFFLLKRSETSILSLRAYTAAQDLSRLRQELSN